MATCLITGGLTGNCKGSSGIYTVYLASRDTAVVSATNTDGKVIDVDVSSTPVVFYPYDMLQKTVAYKESRLVENGAVGFEKTISGTIVGMSQENKDLLDPIEKGESMAILKTKAGKYFLVGEFEGLEILPGEDGIGANITDLNGYLLELGCQEGERSKEVLATSVGVEAIVTVTITSS